MESRRDRLRAATVREISETARRLLVAEGTDAVSLRAIARDMGMTAPALYRYFDNHEELMRHVVGEIYTELTDTLRAAMGRVPGGDIGGRLLAVSRGFREWAREHRREYTLVFGSPIPGLDEAHHSGFAEEAGNRFGWTFLALFLEMWPERPFPIPADEDIDPGLREQLRRYRDGTLEGVELPLGAVQVFLECWVRLQGSVSLEIFGHLDFALDDPGPMFELMLAEMCPRLCLEYTPPPA